MCIDPMTAAAAISGIGSLVSGGIGMAQANAQAKNAERQAALEVEKGAYESARQRDANTRQLARGRGSYLASGISLDGSPAEALMDSAGEASLDEQAIRFGAKINASNLRFQAKMDRMNGASQMIGGALGAITPFINASSQRAQIQSDRTRIKNPYLQGVGLY